MYARVPLSAAASVIHDVGNIHNFCLTDDDCLKKKDNDGDPIRIRKANLSDFDPTLPYKQADNGCFGCCKIDHAITFGQQLVAARTIDPRHAACAYKSRQDAIEHMNPSPTRTPSRPTAPRPPETRAPGGLQPVPDRPKQSVFSRGRPSTFNRFNGACTRRESSLSCS
eukprot:jgi/Undpi1/7819/HiC_scaffold_23.g10292.m1